MKATQPKISIVVCTYNTAAYLEQCLDSILSQQLQEWEVILVDDGSTDQTPAICDRYAHQDERIRVIHKANSGPSDSRNMAISLARADIISFVDSDDWIEPDMLSTAYETMTSNDTDIAIISFSRDFRKKIQYRHLGEHPSMPIEEAQRLLLSQHLQSYICNKVFRRQLLVEPMPVGRFFEDHAVIYKWFSHARRVSIIDKCLYHYRQRQSSTSYNKNMADRRRDLFIADIERYEFAKAHGMEQLGERMLVISGIRGAKDISRCQLPLEEKKDIIKKIADVIGPHRDIVRSLSLKKRLRFYGICNHPMTFIQISRLSGIWARARKYQTQSLFP